LSLASQKGYNEIVNILLDHGAKTDLQTTEGATALMIACANGYIQIVKKLLEKGADVSLKTNDGKSAADLTSNSEIRSLLLNRQQ
jgi:ankyrin repeat protein